MKLVIISDLHISKHYNADIISKMVDRIERLENNDRIVFVVLGDIVDKLALNPDAYQKAGGIFDLIKRRLNNVEFLFVPGNHDLNGSNLESFNAFIENYSCEKMHYSLKESIFNIKREEFNLVLIDSTLSRDYKENGQIDSKLLSLKLQPHNTILFVHHPPLSKESSSGMDDKSIVNNMSIFRSHAQYIFYGHQHGDHKILNYKNDGIKIFAVGSMILGREDVSNNFYVLDIRSDRVISLSRYDWVNCSFLKNQCIPTKENICLSEIRLSEPSEQKKEWNIRRSVYNNNVHDEKASITEIMKKYKYVILNGVAGIGKTVELIKYYYEMRSDDEFIPVWIDVKSLMIDDIKRYLGYAHNNTIDNRNVILIIDGLSEANDEKYQLIVENIHSLALNDETVKILVSKRANFNCTIDKFIQIELPDLEQYEVKEYITKNEVYDLEDFNSQLRKNNYDQLVKVPFYLNVLVELYRSKGYLPRYKDLLSHLVTERIKDSNYKTSIKGSSSLMKNEANIRASLDELALCMIATGTRMIDNYSYTSLFYTSIIDMLNNSGLLILDDKTYDRRFDHDIFMEYFAADYLIKLPLEQVKSIIHPKSSELGLSHMWDNVLDNMLRLSVNTKKCDELIEWIIDTSPEFFFDMESDMLDEENKNNIAIAILDHCIEKSIDIRSRYPDMQRFTDYYQSKTLLKHILEKLKWTQNRYAISSCCSILSHYSEFYDFEKELEDVISHILYDYNLDNEYDLIIALSNVMTTRIDELIPRLITHYKNNNNVMITIALFKTILKSTYIDPYYNFILRQYYSMRDKNNHLDLDVWIGKLIVKLKDIGSELKIARILCKDNSLTRIDISMHIFEKLVQDIKKQYENFKEEIDKAMVDCLIYSAVRSDSDKVDIIKKQFYDHHLALDAIKKLCSKSEYSIRQKCIIISSITDASYRYEIIQLFEVGKIEDQLIYEYLLYNHTDDKIWNAVEGAYYKKNNKHIDRPKHVDWVKLQQSGEKAYFDSLFDKKLFRKYINEIIDMCGDHSISDYFDKTDGPIDSIVHEEVLMSICSYNKYNNIKLSDFIDRVCWDNFALEKIFDFIQNKDNISISSEQKIYLEQWFEKSVGRYSFEDASRNPQNYSFMQGVILLIKKCGFTLDDEKLASLIVLPWYMFASIFISEEAEPYNFVKQYIRNEKVLKDQIIYNINMIQMSQYAKHTHVIYCMENNLDIAYNIAIDLINDTNEDISYMKYAVAKYLKKIKGERYLDSLLKGCQDIELLKSVSSLLDKYNSNMVEAMVLLNKRSGDNMLFLEELISNNSKYGVQKYIELLEKNNGIPDYNETNLEQGFGKYISITDSISKIYDITLLPEIKRMMSIAYSLGFKDNCFDGLKDNLLSTILKLGHKDDKVVIEMLEDIISENRTNSELQRICYTLIDKIIEYRRHIKSECWSFDDIFRIIKENRNY